MKLELGKKYVNRMGDVIGPMEATTGHHTFAESHPFVFEGKTYTEDGSWAIYGDDADDLIAEYSPRNFVVGGEYKDVSGREWVCVGANDEGAHLAMKPGSSRVAYFWNLDGTADTLTSDYNIKFEPVTVWKTFTSDDGETLRVPFVDGVPDYSKTDEGW